MMTEKDLIDAHSRNLEAERLYDDKAEQDKLAYEVTTEKNGITLTFMDYGKSVYDIPELKTGPIFKKRYVRKNDR